MGTVVGDRVKCVLAADPTDKHDSYTRAWLESFGKSFEKHLDEISEEFVLLEDLLRLHNKGELAERLPPKPPKPPIDVDKLWDYAVIAAKQVEHPVKGGEWNCLGYVASLLFFLSCRRNSRVFRCRPLSLSVACFDVKRPKPKKRRAVNEWTGVAWNDRDGRASWGSMRRCFFL